MRGSTILFTKLVGMWDSPNWNADGTWDGQGSGHDVWGSVRTKTKRDEGGGQKWALL